VNKDNTESRGCHALAMVALVVESTLGGGLVWCIRCGTTYGGTCSSPPSTDKRHSYYGCHKRKGAYHKRTREHSCPHVRAEWLEGLV
jgi:hypothetical protein